MTRDTLVFRVALSVAVVHALDDSFFGRQSGVDLTQHAVAGLVSLAAGVVSFLVFPGVRPGIRAAMAISLGVPAIANGVLHVAHVKFDAVAASDLTGLAATAAGIVLVGLGVSIPWRARAERATSTRRRWTARAAAVPLALATLLLVVLPITMAVVETHKPRERVGPPPSAAYANVAFRSTDGLRLSGWYRPSRNGAAVLLAHGGGGDRNGAVDQARMLDRLGYGVLLYDHRGRGRSEGSPNSYGWDWEKDASGALDWLSARPDVRDGRIGGLGLSSGGDALIGLAGERDGLRALVADGAALRTLEDTQRVEGPGLMTPTGWVMFQAVGAMTGSEPSRPLEDSVRDIDVPLLLISAGTRFERDANVLFDRAAAGPHEHWNLPDAGHTGAVRSHRAAYERRVGAFFARTLLGRRSEER